MLAVMGAVLLVVWLYLTKRALQRVIQGIVMLLGGTHRVSLMVYTLLFLPGVVIHELTHFFSAAFLGVRTGDITLFPHEIELDDERVALGSVKIAKTDFVRSSLIGGAPSILGLLLLFLLTNMYLGTRDLTQITQLGNTVWQALSTRSGLITGGYMYMSWALANTLFVSKEDTNSWPILVIFGALVFFLLFFSGTVGWAQFVYPILLTLAHGVLVGAGAASILNTLALGVGWGIQKGLERLRHLRVVYH